MPRHSIPPFHFSLTSLTGSGDFMGIAVTHTLSAFAPSKAPVTTDKKDRHV